MPSWIVKLARRLLGLPPGRYQIILSVHPSGHDISVQDLGKMEWLG